MPESWRRAERLLRVAVSPETAHARDDRRLKVLVHASFTAGRGCYGSPRVHDDLREWHERVSQKRLVRLMQEDGLQARVRNAPRSSTCIRATSSNRHGNRSAESLDRLAASMGRKSAWRLGLTTSPAAPIRNGGRMCPRCRQMWTPGWWDRCDACPPCGPPPQRRPLRRPRDGHDQLRRSPQRPRSLLAAVALRIGQDWSHEPGRWPPIARQPVSRVCRQTAYGDGTTRTDVVHARGCP